MATCSDTAASVSPWNSKNRWGASFMSGTSRAYALKAAMVVASRSSHLARGMPTWSIAAAALAAPSTESNRTTAAVTAEGRGCNFTWISVMTPSVPSDPTSRRVKSYPAEDLRARVPVRNTSPAAVTAVHPSTVSLMVPYRTAAVPEAPHAAMPPMLASAPGSTMKLSPVCLSSRFRCSRVTPASTRASMSSGFTSSTEFMRDKSSDTPPKSAQMWPSKLVPVP
mmetsp:Transcript_68634/g.138018  ORF Transcript_68634/g.138018 Transcript_68634/m.138018 type:complete len:224 (+) Transcript_68634:421-1092(+)